MSRATAQRQPDLLDATQPDLFDGQPEPVREPKSYVPTQTEMRNHLGHILKQARTATTMPWDARKVRFYRKVIPQMVLWLPEEEAAQIKLDFERELARLEAV